MKTPEAVVAGHICLDITPEFGETGGKPLGEVLLPGHLRKVGPADVHLGGCVANTGLAMKKLGAEVCLMAKTGNDDLGRLVRMQLERYGADSSHIRSGSGSTSYSVVLAPPGVDRIFLHCPGVNDEFTADDLDFSVIRKAKIFHLGYPTLMRSLFQNGGEELLKILRLVKEGGTLTSLDLAAVDPDSEAGRGDWTEILRRAMPLVDFFMPSAEELASLIDRPRYESWLERAKGGDAAALLKPAEDVEPLAEKLLSWGARVVLIKCGAPGMLLRTAPAPALCSIGCLDAAEWGNVGFFQRSYRAERVVSAAGAGDTSIAAFLLSAVRGLPQQKCLQYAAATGACCVSACDALSGLQSFAELDRRIAAGWEQ